MDSKLNYKRIVIKIGSSSLTHAETGRFKSCQNGTPGQAAE